MIELVDFPQASDAAELEVMEMLRDFIALVEESKVHGAMLVLVDTDGQITCDTNMDAFATQAVSAYIAYLQLQAIEEIQH